MACCIVGATRRSRPAARSRGLRMQTSNRVFALIPCSLAWPPKTLADRGGNGAQLRYIEAFNISSHLAFFPEEGWLDPVVYAHAMLSAARLRHGAKVICGARVVDLITAGDRVTGVRVADGTQYESDTVVNCAGRWTNEATRDAGLHLPLAPTVGFLVFTPPVATSLSRVVRSTVIHTRPDGAGRLMLHWNPTD